MAFWTAVEATSKDPKRAYRFVLQIPSIGGDAGTSVIWFAKKVDKPTFSLSESEHKYLMHSFYFPGKLSWNEITATVVDPSDPDVITVLGEALQASGYRIFQIDSDGRVVEHWSLHQAWIKEVKASPLDYDGEDLSTIDIVIRYDWAQLGDAGSILGDVGDGIFGKESPE